MAKYSPLQHEHLEKETKAQLIRRIQELRKMDIAKEETIGSLHDQLWQQHDQKRDFEWLMRTREDKIRDVCAIFIHLDVKRVAPTSLVLIQRLLQEALDWQQKKAE